MKLVTAFGLLLLFFIYLFTHYAKPIKPKPVAGFSLWDNTEVYKRKSYDTVKNARPYSITSKDSLSTCKP